MTDDEREQIRRGLRQAVGPIQPRSAEAQLRLREAELSRAQRLSRLGSYEVYMVDGQFLNHRSPEYLALHGLGPESVNEPHDAWVSRVHPEDRKRAEQGFLTAIDGDGTEYETEYRIIRANDGAVRWMKVLVEIERDASGKAISLFGTHRDVTDRKEAEIASFESNRLVNEIMNVFPGVLYVYDLRAGRNLFMNRGSAEAIGYSPEELTALRSDVMGELIHPDDLPRVRQHHASLEGLDDGETAVIEYRLRHKDGSYRWLFSRDLIYQRDEAGRPWQTMGVANDITERKNIEEALRRSQERLQLALKGARAGSWEWTDGAAGSVWSADLREIAGLSLEGEAPSPDEAIAMVAAESRLDARQAAGEIVSRGGPFSHDLKLRRADGRVVWLSVAGTIDHDGAGKPVKAYGIAQDITERKQREEQITLLMREVNHRANNLLGVVQGIARQTAATRPDDFLTAFRGRIQSLAVNQRLLVDSEWRGVGLRDLVLGQTAPFVESGGSRLTIEGPPLKLTSSAAQAIGMALHELASNAVSHGALSVPEGRVAIAWSLDETGTEPRFTMTWKESGGPAVLEPKRKGFGSAVILSMVRVSINGEVDLDYASSGLSWRLNCPTAHVLEPDE
jgi:PAS domain S-box-containing protein